MVKTPCIGVCSTGLGDDVCRGCKRFANEVIDWNGYDHKQRMAVEQRLQQLLSRVVQVKIIITDAVVLQQQIEDKAIRVPAYRNLYCQLVELLRAGAAQITDTHHYGFVIKPEFAEYSLADIYDQIDQEFYMLSETYYRRFVTVEHFNPLSV